MLRKSSHISPVPAVLNLHESVHSQVPVILVDHAGFIAWLNPAARTIFHCTIGVELQDWFQVVGLPVVSNGWVAELNKSKGKDVFISLKNSGNDQRWFKPEVEQVSALDYEGHLIIHFHTLGSLNEAVANIIQKAEFYKFILDQIPADIAVLDKEFRYRFFNRHAIKDEAIRNWMIGKTDLDYVQARELPVELAEKRIRIFQEVIEKKEEKSYDEKITRNGIEAWNLRILTPYLGSNGDVSLVVGYGLNTTNLHQFKEKIEQQGLAIASTGDGIALLNDQHEFIFVNDVFRHYFFPGNENALISTDWKILVQKGVFSDQISSMVESLNKHGVWKGEVKVQDALGAVKYGEVHWSLVSNDRSVIALRDITEKKQRADELNKLATVVSKTNSMVFITNADVKIEWVNDSFTRVTGYSAEEAIGRTPGELLNGPNTDPAVVEKLIKCREVEESFEGEILNYRKDGSPFWLYISSTPIFNSEGRLVNFVNVETDITLIKQTEENALRLLDKEKELSEFRSRFVNLASHEFRTPLTGILGNIELLKLLTQKGEGFDKTERFMDRIIDEVDRMTEMMNNFLHLGQFNAGHTRFKPMYHDFREFVNAQLQLVREKQKGIAIQVTVTGDPVPVYMDVHLMEHVFQNLISNAIKYSPGRPAPVVWISYFHRIVRLSITDFGIGIPGKEIHKLFTSFYRAGNTDNIQGTGLGLVIVKQFVELHNGQIYLQSEEDQGTTITIQLPINHHE